MFFRIMTTAEQNKKSNPFDKSTKPKKYTAFTLIELSVVLLIISIIVAGVVAGGSLIKASKLISFGAKLKNLDTAKNDAVNTKTSLARVKTANSVIGDIAIPLVWFETTLAASYIDTEGTNFGLDGGAVTGWNNLVDSDTDATNNGDPAYIASAINGLPAIRFDGVGDYFVTDGQLTLKDEQTSFMVIGNLTAGAGNSHFYRVNNSSGQVPFINSSSQFQLYNGATLSSGSVITAAPSILTAIWNGASSQVRINAAQVGSTGNAGLSSVTGQLGIGATSIGVGPINGDYGELIIFDEVLSDSQIDQVEEYLSDKWGIVI